MRDQLRKQTEKRYLEENLQGNMKYFMAISIVSKLFNELEFDTHVLNEFLLLAKPPVFFFLSSYGTINGFFYRG